MASKVEWGATLGLLAGGSLIGRLVWMLDRLLRRAEVKPIRLQMELPAVGCMVISDPLLKEHYELSSGEQQLLHNLLDSDSKFRKLMRSEGGADLLILERQHAAKLGLEHFGGKGGMFSPGLYCEHPKDDKVLLPLDRAADILQSEILEEVVRVFEALGATRTVIEDVTELGANAGGGDAEVRAIGSISGEKKKLREMRYEPTTPVDAERATLGKKHIFDLPNVMSVVEARTKGNQTYQKFEETVAVNCGLDVNVLGVFSATAGANYKRRWSFEVEFRSKAEQA